MGIFLRPEAFHSAVTPGEASLLNPPMKSPRARPNGVRGRRAPVLWTALLGAAAVVAGCGTSDGSGEDGTFEARLSRMPVSLVTHATMKGEGAATARVEGDGLVVEGTFAIETSGTTAALHRARPGLRGPAIHELTLQGGEDGSFAGTVPLTEELTAALAAGELYLQVASEKHPDGILRGWLFPR